MKNVTLIAILSFFSMFILLVVGSWFYTPPLPAPGIAATPTPSAPISPPLPADTSIFKSPNIDIKRLQFNLQDSQQVRFTLADVAMHHTKNDCYLAINNKVYDVSSYISFHPGGSRTIISRCGMEVTGIFASIHSNFAWDLLSKYKVGSISQTAPVATPQLLDAIATALTTANPAATVVKVSPKQSFFVAKLLYKGAFYEVHLNEQGQIIKEEVADAENNWTIWDTDTDDQP